MNTWKHERSINQPIRHDFVLIVTISSAKRDFPLIACLAMDKVIRAPESLLCKKHGSSELFYGRQNQRKLVWILHRDLVEPSVINAGPETSILLLDEKEEC